MFVLGTCSVQMPEVRQLLAKLSERDGKIMELTLKLEVRLGLAVGYLGKIGHCTVRYVQICEMYFSVLQCRRNCIKAHKLLDDRPRYHGCW